MSYKVLLVDDEQVDLEWLRRRVSWSELDFEVAAIANSGFAALRILKEQPIDILISDIKMPIMSGLELAQKAREINPNIKIAFISGHEDFSYAKQAIKLNAVGYVLKPVKNQELMELLQSIKDTLDKEFSASVNDDIFMDTLGLFKDEMLHKWLSGNGSSRNVNHELFEYYGIITKGTTCTTAVVEVDDVKLKLKEYDEPEKVEALRKCTDLIADYINYEQLGYYYLSDEKFVTILIKEINPAILKHLMDRLVEKVRKNSNFTVTVGLGPVCQSFEELPGCYKCAREALEYKMFLGKNRVIGYEEVPKETPHNQVNLKHKFKPVFTAIGEYNLSALSDSVDDMFRGLRELNSRKAVYDFILHFLSTLEAELVRADENIREALEEQFGNFELVHSLETLEDIKAWMMKKLSYVSEELAEKNHKKDRRIINDIKKYVQEHLEDRVTLKDVADHFNFSPNYLGYLFKEATGERFSDFLIRLNMERACQYLLDPSLKIYEICDRVGYKNIVYFNRQFKEYSGMTPTEFRRKSRV